jgi:transposase InsO family protein
MAGKISTANVTKLDGNNFQLWKFQMGTIFVAAGVDDIVNGIRIKPKETEEEALKAWKKDDAKIMFLISTAMEIQQVECVLSCKSGREMWTKLSAIHEQKSESNKMILMQRFHEYRMNTSDSVVQHIAKIQNMADQLADVGENVSNVAVMAKILSSLPPKYNALKTAWDSVEPARQTVDALQERLIKEEVRLNTDDETVTAFAAMGMNEKKARGKFGHKNKGTSKRDKKQLKCYSCNKKGHFAWECPIKKDKPGQKDDSQNCAFVSTTDTDVLVSTVRVTEIDKIKNLSLSDVWLTDSGASRHISSRREWFTEFKPTSGEFIRLGDDGECEINGSGRIAIKKLIGNEWFQSSIEDVLYVPKLKKNLFSVGVCTTKEYEVLFKGESVIFLKNNNVCAQGIKQGNEIYRMMFITGCDKENNVMQVNFSSTSLKSWHERYGHVNKAKLREMVKNEVIKGITLTDVDDFFCDACQLGKSHRLPFQKSTKKRNWLVGDFIHSDVCGPMPVESPNGAKYFVTFIDQKSGFRQVDFLRHKSDVTEKFREFASKVKNKFGRSIKVFRSDNGTEYINKELRKFLEDNGIEISNSAPFCPEQNGKPERANRTIVEAARTMMQEKNPPMFLWAEAVNTAVYLQNRTSSRMQPEKTPFELWHNEKPEVSHFRIFGSIAYVHVPKHLRNKWVAKSKKTIFVGYQRDSSNYRLFDMSTKRVTVARDVVFNENSKEIMNEDEQQYIFALSDDDDDDEETEDVHDNVAAEEQGDPENHEVVQQRQLRNRANIKKPVRYLVNVAEYTPLTFQDAINGPDAIEWKKAIADELESHRTNKTWVFAKRKNDMRPIDSKWVFKVCCDNEGKVVRHKARLCARGFNQVKGVDYMETFAPVIRYDSLRIFLALVTQFDLEIMQFDVKTAFLYGDLKEDITMEIPEGLMNDNDHKNTMVCRLMKSWYGLKQAARCWNTKFKRVIESLGLGQCDGDKCIFRGNINGCEVLLAIFVDDGLVASKSQESIETVITALSESFEIKFGNSCSFVGLQIERNRVNKTMFIHQQAYTSRVLEKYGGKREIAVGMPADPNVILSPVEDELQVLENFPYREIVGSLMFLAIVSRPDIAYAVNSVSRFLNRHNRAHWQALQRILKYLSGTVNMGILYQQSDEIKLVGYSDSDFAGDVETRRSTSGYVFYLSKAAVTWASQRQKIVTHSTTEAEYVAAAGAAKEAIWLQLLLGELDLIGKEPVCLFLDNESAIRIVKNPEFHKRTKHIDIKYHYIRERVEMGDLTVQYVSSHEQRADIFTKAFAKPRFIYLRHNLGMIAADEA